MFEWVKIGKRKVIAFLIVLFSLFLTFVIEKFCYSNTPIFWDRVIFILSIGIFISLNYYFTIRKTWEFIFNKRYFIAILLFIYIVVNGYHGSSIGIYDDVIQPNIKVENSLPFFGSPRAIRSDEFLVDTPAKLSQYSLGCPKENILLMGTETNVQLFPILPTKSLSVLATPHNIGYLFLNVEQAFSFAWYLPLFLLFMGCFELFLLITKGKRLISLFGTMMITFSPSMQWWNSLGIITFGIWAIVCFYYFLESNTIKRKILFSFLIGWIGACYIMCVYPAWQIPYGYFFLGLCIWQIYEHRKTISLKDTLYLIPAIIIIVVLVGDAFVSGGQSYQAVTTTVYPGTREMIGGTDWESYFNYFHSILFSFKLPINASESSQFISLYPIPLLMSLWYIIKSWFQKNNKDVLLIILTIVALFLMIFNYFNIPWLSNITMLNMSIPARMQVVVSAICVFIMIILIERYSCEMISKKKKIIVPILSIIFVFVVYKICKIQHADYLTWKVLLVAIPFYVLIVSLFLYNHTKLNKVYMIILSGVLIATVLTVNPISKGLSIITDKPYAKKVHEIVKENPKARWLTSDAFIYLQNYTLANGAAVVNSTNYFPNFDFWHIVDPKKENDFLYNRYSHISININDQKTSLELGHVDLVFINMNISLLKDLNIDYVASFRNDLTMYNNQDVSLEKIYSEDNTTIYKVTSK